MTNIKILHIVTDEKFIDGAINLFDSIEGYTNEYVILDDNIESFKFIKSDKVQKKSVEWFEKHCIVSNDFNIIVLHSLVINNPTIIRSINPQISLIWFSWGYDIYQMLLPIYPLVTLKKQIRGYRKIRYKLSSLLGLAKRIIAEAIVRRGKNIKEWRMAINRIDYYSGVFYEEFDLVKKNKYFKAQRIQFNYTSKKSVVKNENKDDIAIADRKDILIGHQANPLLNHIADLHLLKEMVLPSDTNIICPLSYGPENEISKVCNEGKKLFGNRFKPILDFLPYQEYVKIYGSVKIAIYDIQRQCAVGNNLIGIWDGVKVFLPKDSMNYKHFKNLGLRVYSIEDELNIDNILKPIDLDEVKHNRDILLKHYTYENRRNVLIESLRQVSKRFLSPD